MTVVTDTSVILNLCLLGQDGLLIPLYGTVYAPNQVAAEFQRLAAADSRFHRLVFPSFIQRTDPSGIQPALLNSSRLHEGEVAALTLAMELQADVVLMDERAGRTAAAELGLKAMGLLGILIEARQRCLIPTVGPLIDRLQVEARFWLSPSLRVAILKAVHETP